jgi:hypothetical protein
MSRIMIKFFKFKYFDRSLVRSMDPCIDSCNRKYYSLLALYNYLHSCTDFENMDLVYRCFVAGIAAVVAGTEVDTADSLLLYH